MILLYYQAFFFPKAPDENGPIDKLNKLTRQIGDSFVLSYGSAQIKDVISTAVDSLQDGKIHIGIISANGQYICLAQKPNNNYATCLVFGYGNDKLLYKRKSQGSWMAVREI